MDSILAKRYAKALLELGLADGNQRAYGEELGTFAEALDGAGKEGQLLFSPMLPVDSRKAMLTEILGGCGLSQLVGNFIMLLNERGRFPLLKDTSKAYSGLLDAHEGVARGVVTTVKELDPGQLGGIASALGIYVGKKVELAQKVDESLIGGVIARVGDLEVDGSIRTKLAKLAAGFQGL
jgi:F-type H+-transporting ATPase subunit delta